MIFATREKPLPVRLGREHDPFRQLGVVCRIGRNQVVVVAGNVELR